MHHQTFLSWSTLTEWPITLIEFTQRVTNHQTSSSGKHILSDPSPNLLSWSTPTEWPITMIGNTQRVTIHPTSYVGEQSQSNRSPNLLYWIKSREWPITNPPLLGHTPSDPSPNILLWSRHTEWRITKPPILEHKHRFTDKTSNVEMNTLRMTNHQTSSAGVNTQSDQSLNFLCWRTHTK